MDTPDRLVPADKFQRLETIGDVLATLFGNMPLGGLKLDAT